MLRSRILRFREFGRLIAGVIVGSVALVTAVSYWQSRLGTLWIVLLGGIVAVTLLGVLVLPERAWKRLTGADTLPADLGVLHAEGFHLRSELPWVADTSDAPLNEWEPRANEWLQRVHDRLDGTPWQSTLLLPAGVVRFNVDGYTRASKLKNGMDDALHQLSRIIASAARR